MKRLLIDTHVLIWALSRVEKLSEVEKRVLKNRDYQVYVSAASIWEMAIKASIEKLTIPEVLEKQLEENNFEIVPVDFRLALQVKDLPMHHMDPFDRMIIATALEYDLPLMTHDPIFKDYQGLHLF